jgi:hypothetical protein
MKRFLAIALPLFLSLPATVGCVAESQVRSLAADDLGCPSSHIQIEQLGGSTYLAKGCGMVEQYDCSTHHEPYRRLVCERETASYGATIEASPPAPSPALLGAPNGGGGFLFGATEDDARRTCEQAGHTYAREADGSGTCDGVAADVGAPAHATVGFCDGKVCGVTLQVDLAPGESPARALVRWKGALVERYGGPSTTRTNIPSQCEADVTPCLVDRTGTIRFYWQWPSRERIALWPQIDDAQRASVSIAYIGPRKPSGKTPGL